MYEYVFRGILSINSAGPSDAYASALLATTGSHTPIRRQAIIQTNANWTIENQLQGGLDQNTIIFVQENELGKVACKMTPFFLDRNVSTIGALI